MQDFSSGQLGARSSRGWLSSLATFSIVMLILFLIVMAVNWAITPAAPFSRLLAIFLCVFAPMSLGIVAHQIPRGDDWLMARLGLATFCRTGLPLLIVLFVSQVVADPFETCELGLLVLFYLCGILTSVWISVQRLVPTVSLVD